MGKWKRFQGVVSEVQIAIRKIAKAKQMHGQLNHRQVFNAKLRFSAHLNAKHAMLGLGNFKRQNRSQPTELYLDH